MKKEPKIQVPASLRLEPVDFSEEHQRPVYRRKDVLREAKKLSAGGPLDVMSGRAKR